MSNQKDYVPDQLIIKIGDCLLAVDGLGHQVYSARYLEKNHLSGRAQDHFRHHESVSVMQLYAAIRILLINTSSVWDRILLMCRILDILEQCFCDCYSGVTLHPLRALKKVPVFGKTNKKAASYCTSEQFSDGQILNLFCLTQWLR